MKNVLLFLGANSSAANISLDSSVLNIDNTTIYEDETDTESILGQAHHMLSRFLNLGFFFTNFFLQGRLFLVRSKSTNKTVYHNRKIHFAHSYKQFKIKFRENIWWTCYLANSFANVSIGPSQYGDDFDYQRRI